MRSLVVEDTRVSQMVLEKILAAYGDCQVAKTGVEALHYFTQALANHRPFDLICLDVGLPDLSGIEVLTKIRAVEDVRGVALDHRVNIIAITATSDADTVKAFTEMGNGYLLKPVYRERLIRDLIRLGLIPYGEPPTPAPEA